MNERLASLRTRLAVTCAVFGASVVALLSLAIAYGAHDVTQRLMDQTLSAEIEDYIARRSRNPASLPPAGADLRGFVSRADSADPAQPEPVRALPPGRHDLVIDGTPYRVAVEVRRGWRYVILFDETRHKRREASFTAWLSVGAAGVILLVFFGAWRLAGRALTPLSALACALADANPEHPLRLSISGRPGDEIDTLIKAFQHFQTRLAAFIERERAFTADASHELRTSLTVIRGAAELLAHDATLSATQRARAARIERASQRLGELVDALLLLAREKPPEGECNAVIVVRETFERLAPQCGRDLQVELDLPESLVLPLEAPLFAILFGNLLHNACKHAARRVIVSLSAEALVVRDDGPGMSDEALAAAATRYWRGPQSRGAGIGLALAARISALAGFTLRLGNAPEGGLIAEVNFSLRSADINS